MLDSPLQITTKEALHHLSLCALRAALEQIATLRLHLPMLRGEMRVLSGMPFHLAPELFLQLSGETHFIFPEEEAVVGPGEICIVPRGMPHREKVRGREAPFANLVFYPEAQFLFHLAHEAQPGRPAGLISDTLDGVSRSCSALLEEAVQLRHNGHATGEAGARGALAAVLAHLIAALEGQVPQPSDEPVRVANVRQQIFMHLHDPTLTVATLAAKMECSADHLSRLFRQATGISLQTYLIEQRLARAMELLETTPLNIAEISQATGFRDPAYFTRAFRQRTGSAPREARKRGRNAPVSP